MIIYQKEDIGFQIRKDLPQKVLSRVCDGKVPLENTGETGVGVCVLVRSIWYLEGIVKVCRRNGEYRVGVIVVGSTPTTCEPHRDRVTFGKYLLKTS